VPAALFDQTLAPRVRNTRPFGTVSISVLLHAVALVVVLAWHVTASTMPLPDPPSVPVFVASRVEVPTPPPVRPVTRTPTTAINPIPTTPPQGFTKEPDTLTPVAGPPPLGTLPVGPSGPGGFAAGPTTIVSTLQVPPAPPSVVHVGGEIKAPTRVHYVAPTYPSIAQISRVEGEVLLEATIDETGAVRNVVVRHSVPLLDRAAIEAVSQWRYSPTLLNGRPVSVIMQVGVKFTLK
jgi:periplasmic protein TonB